MANKEDQIKFFGSAELARSENADPFFGLDLTAGDKTDPLWDFAFAEDLKPRWNKLYPFQLMIIKRENGSYAKSGIKATFTLPIPPQELTISTPFAISTQVTLGGIVEEHNGAPLRNITLRGTTGVVPLRTSMAAEKSKLLGVLQDVGVFGGTITAVTNAISAVKTVVSQVTNLLGGTDGTSPPNVNADSLFAGDMGKTTGYYQMELLKRFLESYINQKKTAAGKDLRLALCVWKEQAVYLVTPVNFDVIRNATSPLEYMYNLQFRAWRRIQLRDSTPKSFEGHVGVKSPSKFAQIVNILESSRHVLAGAQNTLKAVRADIKNTLFTPLRQVILFSKDVRGLATSVADFPDNLVSDLRQPLLEMFGDKAAEAPKGLTTAQRSLESSLKALSVESVKNDTKTGTTKSPLAASPGANSADKAIANPEEHFETFASIKMGDLNVRPETARKIEEEKRKVRLLRREDFEAARDSVLTVLADFSDAVGAGHPTYTRIYGTPERTPTKVPTDDDWEIIHALSQVATAMDSLATSSDINQDQISSIDYIAGLASRSGIAFTVPKSKFAVPFLYGHTLEQLADRYLHDPNRWHEIAALNGLRAPYVDEVGFELPFLVNGSGNQVLVSDGSRYFSGQLCYVGSTSVRREKRRIQKVEQLGPGQFVLTLSGASDLQKYTIVAQARVQAFLPDTINSQMQIYIPSDEEALDEDFKVKSIPGVDYFDPLVRSGGIDLLLTARGDLVITPDGDCRLAVGLTNIIQKVRLAIGTPRGSLLHHPEFGLGVKPGTSIADLSAQDLLAETTQLFKDDPGFSGVQAATVRINGNSLQIGLGIGIAGTSQVVPVQIDVRR